MDSRIIMITVLQKTLYLRSTYACKEWLVTKQMILVDT